jgi:hypothetical protein
VDNFCQHESGAGHATDVDVFHRPGVIRSARSMVKRGRRVAYPFKVRHALKAANVK